MLGQRLDGAGKIKAKVFGRKMRDSRLHSSAGGSAIPSPPQQTKTGAPGDREYPRRERGHRPQRSDAPVKKQQRFLDGVVDVSRPAIARGIAPDIGLGRRYQRHQGFLVAATRGFDQPGVAAPGSGQGHHSDGSLRPAIAHIGQNPKNPVIIIGHNSGTGDQIPGHRAGHAPGRAPSMPKSPYAIIDSTPDRPHRPLPARQILAIKHNSSL